MFDFCNFAQYVFFVLQSGFLASQRKANDREYQQHENKNNIQQFSSYR